MVVASGYSPEFSRKREIIETNIQKNNYGETGGIPASNFTKKLIPATVYVNAAG